MRAAIGLLASADGTSVLDIWSNVESRCAGEGGAVVNADDKKFRMRMECITVIYTVHCKARRTRDTIVGVSTQRV